MHPTTIGLDIAKHVFQVHAVERHPSGHDGPSDPRKLIRQANGRDHRGPASPQRTHPERVT